MLQINNIEVVYSDVILVLRGISLAVPDNQIVSLLGANGAGKSTTLKAISGLLRTQQGEVTRGSIEWNGERIDRKSPDEIVQMGIVQLLEGRRLFEHSDGRGESAHGRDLPQDDRRGPAAVIWTRYMAIFRAWRSFADARPAICPGASSRWSPLGGR